MAGLSLARRCSHQVPSSPLQLPAMRTSSRDSLRHDNRSSYSLATVHDMPSPTARTSLLAPDSDEPSYGTTPPAPPSNRRILLYATLKMAAVFILSTAFLGGTLWFALPTLDEEDRPDLRVPKSFAQLQALNTLLKKYRDIYPYRIIICYVNTYLFLQAFSLPGSMYLSILGGAMWGVPRALLLACTCVASGATLCYLISAAFGPALLTMPKWKARADIWAEKISAQKDNLISYLIVLRIAPLPPHWVVNVLCPHLGIGIIPFWISTWLGILGVTVIHTTIGGSLDDMTSAADFHLISWKNFFMLTAVVIGVMIPVGLRYYFKSELATVVDVEADAESIAARYTDDASDLLLEEGPQVEPSKGKDVRLIMLSDDEEDYSDGESDEDIILEAGPALVVKAGDKPVDDSRRDWRQEDLL
ncbi:oxalate transporter [Laetiporus sulphureus 93-53]|uniref:Oxalate transporter n=1 Tax=Laetiporus sulphureus 93-53 TaxID=1314785 RepID=A0A165E2G0_9APHY|nr:oxalate transporter [Laetiporus sulphureus 93-53]KZT06117.1 oxalate transporter [Laetiporus sulphureus 93-53]